MADYIKNRYKHGDDLKPYEQQLGRITSAWIGREGHGLLTFGLQFDFGGSAQLFGGLMLSHYDKKLDRQVGTAGGLDIIVQLLDLFDVERFEQIKGRSAFVLRRGGWNSSADGLLLPDYEGARFFLVDDWRRQWWPEIQAEHDAAREKRRG